MKTPYEIAKDELQDFTQFPTIGRITDLMEIYGRQCFRAGRESEWNMNVELMKYENYEQYRNELK